MKRFKHVFALAAALLPLWLMSPVGVLPSAAAASAEDEAAAYAAAVAAAARAAEQGAVGSGLPPKLAEEDAKDYAAHLKWQRKFYQESYAWHLFSTRLLMGVVLAIVGCGLWFTYIQFTRSTARAAPVHQSGEVAPPQAEWSPTPTSVKIGPGGLEITSQVIGLLVLGFSLAFFYLYVRDVYPIQESQLRSHADADPAAAVRAAAPAASQ